MHKQLAPTRRLALLWAVLVLIIATIIPIIRFDSVDADELTARKVTIDKSYINATDVSFAFSYTIATSAAQQGIIYQFCTTPLSTCTLPTGMSVQSATHDSQSGWPTDATAFAPHAVADEGDCDMATTSSKMCFERTDAVAGNGAVTHTISGITAPSSNQTVYVRISLYSDDDFETADKTDNGVVASAFVNQLTVSARVQERLVFCVGSVDAASAGDCTDISGTTIDIGVVDFSQVCVTGTLNPCEDDDGRNGYALIQTNAQSGVVVTYYAEQETSSGKLKVPGATCTDNISTLDQCFNSTGTTKNSIVAGTEEFGMTISEVNTSKGGLTTNLTRDAEYAGDGTAADGFAWDDTGTIDEIATSTSVLDDEMLVLRFAASASLTTPTGQYIVTSTYVATPTF